MSLLSLYVSILPNISTNKDPKNTLKCSQIEEEWIMLVIYIITVYEEIIKNEENSLKIKLQNGKYNIQSYITCINSI